MLFSCRSYGRRRWLHRELNYRNTINCVSNKFLEVEKNYSYQIKRDTYGVPHVHGMRDKDAAFGFAYAQAEDDLEHGQLRLLEVDNRITIPVKTHVRVVVTAADVLHA